MTPKPSDIVEFWRAAGSRAWFAKDPTFDETIRVRFESVHHAAARGELTPWAETATGALALLLLLDQFPRNIWRNSAHAFATDALARNSARSAIASGHDHAFPTDLRAFFYLPFMHSEDLADQDYSMQLAQALEADGGQDSRWARMHRDIIVRFRRFPHRNACMGRVTTSDEAAFLAAGGFAG